MKAKLIVMLAMLILTPAAFAITDIAVGPYCGMAIPVVNESAESGMMYGIQAKVSLIPMLSIGGHYSSRNYGNPTIIAFEGTEYETEMESDGGSMTYYGIDAYLGNSGGTGANLYAMGSFGSYKWERDDTEDISKTAFAAGLGIEYVLPMKIGIDARALMEFASNDDSTYKSFLWFVGLNYHFGLGPM